MNFKVKIFYLTMVCIMMTVLLSGNNVHSQLSEDDFAAVAKLEKTISDQIDEEKTDFRNLAVNINKMEKITISNPVIYTRQLAYIVGSLQNKGSVDEAVQLANSIIEKITFFSFGKNALNDQEKLEVQNNQLLTVLAPVFGSRKTDFMNDCDPIRRKKFSAQLLSIYQNIIQQIDEAYDPNADENQMVTNGFVPPPTYTGGYMSGMDFSHVDDKATRNAYKKYKEEQQQKGNVRHVQITAREIRKRYREPVQTYLIDAYSLFPYRTKELEVMLTDYKVAPEMAKEILDAVRKNEIEFPDNGFRVWQTEDKMLRVTAKFISYDEKTKDITLEKEDGSQMVIELSAFRKEDQEFVKRQKELKSAE